MFYVSAYYADNTPCLGNLDGQAVLRAQCYQRTHSYKRLKNPVWQCRWSSVHHWCVETTTGVVVETITNPYYK